MRGTLKTSDLDDRKLTSRYMFSFVGEVVSWKSKLHKFVIPSTTKVKYIAMTEVSKEVLWIKKFLEDLGLKQDGYLVNYDSQTEAEYIAMIEAGKEMLWMKNFLKDLGLKQDGYLKNCDSQSDSKMSKNVIYYREIKHVNVRYH